MSKSKYFTDKFSTADQKLLYENPGNFLTSHKQQLTRIVYNDMRQLATIVTPVHSTEYGSNQWETWTDHTYWYHVNQNKKEIAANMFDVYYPMCGLRVPERWDFNGNTVFELNVPRDAREIKDVIFNCLRAVYFYDNYGNQDKWGMSIPGNQNICPRGQIYVDDFADFDYKKEVYKLRHDRKVLLQQIDNRCEKIANSCKNVITSDVLAEKRTTDVARAEIEHAYAILKKYGLMDNNKQYS